MSATITIHKYSGRPDPEYTLTPEQASRLAEFLAKERAPASLSVHPADVPRLGYRGISLTSNGVEGLPHYAIVYDGALQLEKGGTLYLDTHSEVEKYLLGLAGHILSAAARERVAEQIEKNVLGGPGNSLTSQTPLGAPAYNPDQWNDDLRIRMNNNCYN